MPGLQIPNVAIEDLQAFQAKHFPGSEQTTAFDYAYNENIVDGIEEEDDYDGLGYYPDGVKRTLTDEQIEIFRHSEIHALLREKQLREEALAEMQESGVDEEADEDMVPEQERAQCDTADAKDEKLGGNTLANEGLRGSELPRPTESTVKKHPETSYSENSLDYSEGAAGQSTSQKNTLSGNHAQFAGRRIISYED